MDAGGLPADPVGVPAGAAGPESDIADPALAGPGKARIGWARQAMPVLARVTEQFAAGRPFAGLTVAACLHVTAETAVLVQALQAGGARVLLAASNPLSTQDDIAAAVAASGAAAVFARAGAGPGDYSEHIHRALAAGPGGPDLVMDDGGDLVNTLHAERADLLPQVRGGCESTSTGVLRLRRMAAEGALGFPMVAADETATKRVFDNTWGTGQSTLDGIIRATNLLLAGKVVVVAGYGACGRGIAERARGLGAQVIVTEVDPVRALEAIMGGLRVMPMAEAAPLGDVFITATGSREVISGPHLAVMRDGAVLANAGHFDVEIDLPALTRSAAAVSHDVRPNTDEYLLPDGRRLLLLAEGRVVNLVAAEGSPATVMDVSFAGQALALAWLAGMGAGPGAGPGHPGGGAGASTGGGAGLAAGVHPVPSAIEDQVARLALEAAGGRIDELSRAQQDYLNSWRH